MSEENIEDAVNLYRKVVSKDKLELPGGGFPVDLSPLSDQKVYDWYMYLHQEFDNAFEEEDRSLYGEKMRQCISDLGKRGFIYSVR